MNVAYVCVLAAALMPYFFVGYAKATRSYFKGGNREPRRYAEGLSGARKRAYSAHLNAFEAFPPFAAAVIIATLAGAQASTIDALALTFVCFRVAYGVLYIADLDKLRSLAWGVGMACTCSLFIMAAIV